MRLQAGRRTADTVISAGVFCRQLVGRRRELDHLAACMRPDGPRRSALVVLRGEAGVGKTRLVAELVARAERDGLRTVVTTVREYANSPYSAIVETLEALGAQAELEREAPGAESDEKWRRFAAVVTTFTQIARADTAGLLVVLEDVHWAGGGTIELLRFLAQGLAGESVIFVATHRVDEVALEPDRVRALAGLERDAAETITIEPLGDAEVDRLLRSTLRDIDRTLPPQALDRIRELAEGLPLLAEELLRGALERRDRDGDGVNVPASIRITVHERFASLPERDRDILLHAAVAGRRFSAHFVARLIGLDPVTVFAALRRARDLQLVVEDDVDDAGDTFAFRHALTHEVVYSQLLRAEARALHARAAEVLAPEEPLDVTAIAEHAWRARDVEHAIGWNERAGDHALALFAHADAARHYARACEIAKDHLQRAQLAEKAAEAMYANGDIASAVARFSEAIEALADDPSAHRLALRKAYLLFDQGRYDDSLREAQAVVTRLGDEDSPMRFDAETMTAGLLTARGRPQEALTYLQRADSISARGATITSARFAGNYAYCLGMLGRADEARERFAQARREARAQSDTDVLLRALNNHAIVELSYGPISVARALFAEGLELARSTNNLRFVAWLSQNAALSALTAGDAPATAQHLARAEAIRHDVGTATRWALATALRSSTLMYIDDAALREEARRTADAAIAEGDTRSAAILTGAVAHDLLRAGRIDEATGLIADTPILADVDAPYWLHDVAGRCGSPEVRAAARAALAAAAERPGALAARGFVALADAREALRKRRREDAVELAGRAVEAFRSVGWRTDEAFALEVAGRTADAVALFRAIGATGEVRRLTETAKAPRRRGESTLTGREREIAGLLVAGRSTRAIAAALVISERTVETHIAAIYRKLGVSTRAGLAQLLDEATP
jgi:ATP/maltotriose-dependent transcriptional regulator MalT